jgi:flagellar motor switch protein FliN/FliY
VLTEAEIQRMINNLHHNTGPKIVPVQFAPLQPVPLQGTRVPISHLADIRVNISAQLGRVTLTVKEILALEEGSVFALESLAGEPVVLLVNEQPLGKGEVVVINDAYGIRITALAEVKN